MPEQYVYEMVADWTGAGRAQGKAYNETFRYDETRTWYQKNGGKMILHNETRKLVEHILQTNLK